MKQPTDSAIKQKNTSNIFLRYAQHLHYLNTLIDIITWLVTSVGRYVHVWGYRLLTGTRYIYLKES